MIKKGYKKKQSKVKPMVKKGYQKGKFFDIDSEDRED